MGGGCGSVPFVSVIEDCLYEASQKEIDGEG